MGMDNGQHGINIPQHGGENGALDSIARQMLALERQAAVARNKKSVEIRDNVIEFLSTRNFTDFTVRVFYRAGNRGATVTVKSPTISQTTPEVITSYAEKIKDIVSGALGITEMRESLDIKYDDNSFQVICFGKLQLTEKSTLHPR